MYKRTWWIILPTVLTVLAFQTYWLVATYRDQRRTFYNQAKDALQYTYDQAFMESLVTVQMKQLHSSPKAIDSAIRDIMEENEISFSSTIIASDTMRGSTLKNARTTTMSREDLQPFLSSILSNMPGLRPDSQKVLKTYIKELAARGIGVGVELSYAKNTDTTGNHISIPLSISEPDNKLHARFSGVGNYLMKKMSGPVIISLILLLIVAGCIWVLWRIIMRQKALEAMRSDFISNITHELKTPVAILSTINESLLTYNGMDDKNKTERYLRLSKDELNKLQGHIEEILTLSKMENGIALAESNEVLLPEVLNMVQQRYIHLPGVYITTVMEVTETIVQTHRESLFTILNNLVDNSIKYADKPEKRIELRVKQQDTSYLFSVTDNGIGISKEHLPFIFDKFYRVPQGDLHNVKGYGLGLSYVKELVSRLGGSIKVSSTPGSGSLFTFKIPGA
ncbi:sensor histidine kinase [Chitinophaga niabensis]|uniref:histidine kinase n=1 Tax=Chitinophaga niabensis TaxID=536979 RepID=A0A1N6DAW2_9BACT|nr:HAMP domain-containing sensor histidine kinase [Chitinophaga niabensis]SIN67833.1 His Kinase A (phospho-acceptor) domain-containing protein [Chitinophaga niabensis]